MATTDKIFSLELTTQENTLVPLVIQMIEHRDKSKVFSNAEIRKVLKAFGHTVADSTIRRLVNYIRNSGKVELLIANQDGYFVANNIDDIRTWIAMHRGKIKAMGETLNSIETQFDKNMGRLHHGSSGLMGQLSIFDFDNDM